MKRIFAFLALVALLTIGVNAQSPFRGFLKPVTSDLFASGDKAVSSQFLLRPSIGVTSNLLKWDNTIKKVYNLSFARVGIGLSYAHFIEVEGMPYNNYSIDGFVLLPTDMEVAYFSFGVAFSALDIYGFSPHIGPLYDFNKNRPFIENIGLMTGVKITF
jgi:hypothetical protein